MSGVSGIPDDQDVRPLRIVPTLVDLRDRYGDPIWILGVELWTNMVVLRFAGIETEMTMHADISAWFQLRDDRGESYQPHGGGRSGSEIGSALEHKQFFSGHLDFWPGLTDGATTLTVSFSDRIRSDPIDIQVG